MHNYVNSNSLEYYYTICVVNVSRCVLQVLQDFSIVENSVSTRKKVTGDGFC